jgi:type IV pilus assembly protein PilM
MKAGKNNVSLGLDIGTHYLKMVELCEEEEGIVISKCCIAELPHEAIVDKQIMDGNVVAEHIRSLVKESHAKSREVTISVAGRGVIIKKIVTDRMNQAELADAIEWEARQHIPYDISEVSLDYQVLHSGMEQDHTDVLLVAAKNDLVDSGWDVAKLAGLNPQGIDLDAFGVQNALYQSEYIPEHGTVAILHMGYNSTNATIIKDGVFEVNRDIAIAGKLYLERVVRRLGIPIKEGFQLLQKGTSEGPRAEVVNEIIRDTTEKLVESLERAFPTYWSSDAQSPVSKVILCGGGALFPGIKDCLMERMELLVEVADPLKALSRDSSLPDDINESISPTLTLAVGLALEGLGKVDGRVYFNLLPNGDKVGKASKYLDVKRAIIPAAVGSLALFGAIATTVHQNVVIGNLHDQVAVLDKESSMYQEKIDLVEEFTAKRNDIMARVQIIEDLDRDRFLRVRLLDEINRLLPTLTWMDGITELASSPGTVIIEGITTNNLKVSEFMASLMTSDLFETVDLTVSQQKEIGKTSITTFTIQVKIKGAFNAGNPIAEAQNAKKKSGK